MKRQLGTRRRRKPLKLTGLESLEHRRLLTAAHASGHLLADIPLDTSDPTIRPERFRSGGSSVTAEDVLNLQSKPDANFTIFLDFDGHVTEGTSWNIGYGIGTIVSPPFDLDGNPTSFGELELERMLTSWQRTAEDFAPFDINVTTRDPGPDALIRSGDDDTQWGARAVVTDDTFASCGCGGHAYLNSFNDDTDTPTFVYNQGDGSLGETISHEVGHMLGLVHDGTSDGGLAYYPGHGNGDRSWGAIMGAPFDKEITQWDRGEFFDANNAEDDLSVITSLNGFGYRSDDYGDTRLMAGELEIASGSDISGFGIIERSTDIDYFLFHTGAGNVSFDIRTLTGRPNLDVWAGLYDNAGNLLAQANPPDTQSASFSDLNLSAGTYYLRIEGVGSQDVYNPASDTLQPPPAPASWQLNPAEGYSDYGSLGQYAITGFVIPAGNNSFRIAASDAVKMEPADDSVSLTFTVSRSGDTTIPAAVEYVLRPTLPEAVGQSYPSLADANDFVPGTALVGTVSFLANESAKTVTFDVAGDNEFEQDEFFDVALMNPTSGWVLSHSQATGTILSDESRIGITPLTAAVSVFEGPYSGTLLRWRQVAAANGALDEWALDNVGLTNSTFGDDFDPAVDPAQWNEISNGIANSNFVGGTGNGLFMSGAPERWATSQYLSPQPGDVMTFDLVFGDNSNGGENADPGEDVVLEYSIDGGSNWIVINTYDTEDYTTWTTIQETLPDGINDTVLGSMHFVLARDGGSSLPATVNWQLDSAGLIAPADDADFPLGVFPSGQVTFQAGEVFAEIQVEISGDADFEPDERFTLELISTSGDGMVALDSNASTATGTILNDDSSYVVNPGPQFRWRQIDFSSGNFDNWGLDNVAVSGSLFADDFDPTIDSGQWESVLGGGVNSNFGGTGNSIFFAGGDNRVLTSRRVDVEASDVLSFDLIFGDDTNGGENPEPGEGVVLEYSTDGGLTWTFMREYDPTTITTWTTMQEPIPTAALPQPLVENEGDAGSTIYTFVVARVGGAAAPATVNWEVVGSGSHPANAADFVGNMLPGGTLVFAANETTKAVQVQVAGDSDFEPDEFFDFVILTTGNPRATAAIVNDDATPSGDFNGDGQFNCLDIDELIFNVAGQTGNAAYDLNGDGAIDVADVDRWLATAGAVNLDSGNPYLPGDANLDGNVDASDFNAWNAHKFTSGNGWCGGDFNADGSTDASDFNLWNAHKFSSALDAGIFSDGQIDTGTSPRRPFDAILAKQGLPVERPFTAEPTFPLGAVKRPVAFRSATRDVDTIFAESFSQADQETWSVDLHPPGLQDDDQTPFAG